MASFTTRWKFSRAIFSISSLLMPIFSKQAKRFGISEQFARPFVQGLPAVSYTHLDVYKRQVEPCETESKQLMDEVCDIYCKLYDMAYTDPEALHTAPHNTPVRRLDEVGAARNMILRYHFEA